MSDRPAPLTTTDTMLGLVLDELQSLRADLAGRGGTPAPQNDPGPKPAPGKKVAGKKPALNIDGS